MKIIKLTENNLESVIKEAVLVLQNGGIVVYPTETVYGVGVDATNNSAVSRLLKYKNRPAGKAISVLVTDQAMAQQHVFINKTADNIYSQGFYDLIFPLFLFISGVSTPYSVGREVEKGVENQKILLRIIKSYR